MFPAEAAGDPDREPERWLDPFELAARFGWGRSRGRSRARGAASSGAGLSWRGRLEAMPGTVGELMAFTDRYQLSGRPGPALERRGLEATATAVSREAPGRSALLLATRALFARDPVAAAGAGLGVRIDEGGEGEPGAFAAGLWIDPREETMSGSPPRGAHRAALALAPESDSDSDSASGAGVPFGSSGGAVGAPGGMVAPSVSSGASREGIDPSRASKLDDRTIAGWNLSGCQVVVLSAAAPSRIGLEGEDVPTEGWRTLQDAFLRAGAEAVLAARWRPSNDDAVGFVRALGEALFPTPRAPGAAPPPGLPLVEATRRAQLRRRFETDGHPRRWGAWTLRVPARGRGRDPR